MPRARKLFPIYGSALANNMFMAVQSDRMVSHFIAGYVAEHDREGILGGPARDRELAETVGREILLCMIAEAHEALPAFFGRKQKSKLKKEEKETVEAFSTELLAALARALNWSAEDRREFRRDLVMYSDFRARQELAVNVRKRGATPQEEAPFIARVALLLDPSMLEQARRAAREFHAAVCLLARKLLRRTLSPGRR
jgi:hypothetical protein